MQVMARVAMTGGSEADEAGDEERGKGRLEGSRESYGEGKGLPVRQFMYPVPHARACDM